MSKAKSTKSKRAKHARKPQPNDGELADDALDQVAGGGGVTAPPVSETTSAMQVDEQSAVQQLQQAFQTVSKISKASHDTAQALIKNLKA